MAAQGLSGLLVPMGCQIVQDDNGAWLDLRNEHFSDVGGEGRTVHWPLDDPWCDQCVLGQPRNQCLCSPASKGGIHRQAMASLGPAAQPGQVCLHRRFVNKDNALRQGTDGGQTMFEPVGAPLSYLGAAALRRDQ